MEIAMNTTRTSQEIKIDRLGISTQDGREVSMESSSAATHVGLTLSQRLAVGFAAGVLGAAAVVLFSYVLFGAGVSEALGVTAPASLKSPDIYRPLFWGGLWGVLFGA